MSAITAPPAGEAISGVYVTAATGGLRSRAMTNDDPMAEPLGELAAKAHAALYSGYDFDVVERQSVDDPGRGRFDAAVNDGELSALFPAGQAGYVWLSTGGASTSTATCWRLCWLPAPESSCALCRKSSAPNSSSTKRWRCWIASGAWSAAKK